MRGSNLSPNTYFGRIKLVEQRVVLHDQEAEVVFLQDGHELEDGKGAAHIQLGDVSIQLAEDAGVVAADEDGLVALQFRVAVESAGQHLHWCDQNAEGIGEQGNGGEEFYFHDREQGAPGISDIPGAPCSLSWK